MGTAADIAHEALFIGVDLLELAPVPGLRPAAQLLLNIWDASQQVDVSLMPAITLKHYMLTHFVDEPPGMFASHGTMRRHPHFRSRRDL